MYIVRFLNDQNEKVDLISLKMIYTIYTEMNIWDNTHIHVCDMKVWSKNFSYFLSDIPVYMFFEYEGI